MTDEKKEQKSENPDLLDLSLSFVPEWARQSPSTDPYAGKSFTSAPRRSDGARGGDRREGNRRGGSTAPRPPIDRARRHERIVRAPNREEGRSQESGRRFTPYREPEPQLPIQVSFIPEQERLAALVADIRSSVRAFPLPDVAGIFMSNPEWHQVKLEALKQTGGRRALHLFQDRATGLIFLDREEAIAHVMTQGLKDLFITETVQKDPPAGNFLCVARCRLSGVLLGPPNHHGYNERLESLHRTRFGNMALEDYRRQVETSREPELIERWKEEWRTHTLYRLREEGDTPAEPMEEKEAIEYLREKIAPQQVVEMVRVVLPGPLSRDLSDPRLRNLLRQAWAREERFPVTLIRALRGAFRRMGLHLFDEKNRTPFVTSIEPRPIEKERVVSVIAEIIEWLKAHPGSTRQDLVSGIRPQSSENMAQVGEVVQPLLWLIEKGHVIEFHNGRLVVPADHTPPAPKPEAKAKTKEAPATPLPTDAKGDPRISD